MGNLIEIRPHNIDQRSIQTIVNALKKGELAIVPTDSIYAIVGDLNHRDVLEKICKQIGKKPNKANLSILCDGLSNLSKYTSTIPNPLYKLMKRVLPGPFTFILKANNNIPKIFRQNKKTIGIRVPDNTICQALISGDDKSPKIIPDFRPPSIIRIGITPLYTCFEDLWWVVYQLKNIVESKSYLKFDKKKSQVT